MSEGENKESFVCMVGCKERILSIRSVELSGKCFGGVEKAKSI